MKSKDESAPDNFSNMLISVLAHDLRQPFAAFILAADALKYTKRTLSPEELHVMFEEIRGTASKSIDLLDGLLCWMKSKKEGYTYQTQPLLLHDLIHEANSLYLRDQLDRNVSLYNIVPERQLVYADKQMIQFINRNILSNATKYSPPGGIIGVTCSVKKKWLTVAFTDQGRGITADKLDKIFNINTTKRQGETQLPGAGIALSICRDMIKIMNGKIWAQSIIGEGVTFYYSLPLAES